MFFQLLLLHNWDAEDNTLVLEQGQFGIHYS